MCNFYSITHSKEAMRIKRDPLGNFPGLPAIFPDTMAPVVRTAPDGERGSIEDAIALEKPLASELLRIDF
jgi:hypothetical protein